MHKTFFTIFFILTPCITWAQNDHFLVEIEPFAPDVQQMVEMMEGNPAEEFEALDMDSIIQNFHDYHGEYMMLWFWNVEDDVCESQVDGFNLLHQFFSDQIHFIGFTYDNRVDVAQYISIRSIDFPIVPNSLRIGELLYGSELQQGRVFLIDRQGIIRKAIPRQFFIDNQNCFSQLRTFISEMISENE